MWVGVEASAVCVAVRKLPLFNIYLIFFGNFNFIITIRQRIRVGHIKISHLQQYLPFVDHYMRVFFRIAFGLMIIWFGIMAIKQSLGGYNLGLFHEVQYIPFGLLVMFTALALLLDTSCYMLDKGLYQYGISLIGLTLCGVVIIKIIQNKSVDNAATVMEVTNLPGAANVFTFQFKANNDFRLLEFNRLGQTVYYGKYDKLNDTLFIGDNNYNGYVKNFPKTGIIKADTVYWSNFDTMLIDKK